MLSCPTCLLLRLFCVVALLEKSLALKQKIYYGEADLIDQLLNDTSQWTYVQENVDGFYVSFGQLIVNLSIAKLLGFFKLFIINNSNMKYNIIFVLYMVINIILISYNHSLTREFPV